MLSISPQVVSITGTANQVVADVPNGAVTLSLPQSIATSSTPQFARLGLGAAADATQLLRLNGTNPTFLFENGSNTKSRLTSVIGDWVGLTQNLSFNGTNWVADSASIASWVFKLDARAGQDVFDIGRVAVGGTPVSDYTHFFQIQSTGNIKIAGTAARGTTEGTNHLDIFNGTAPVGTLTNGISLYSTSGELRVMDSAGNATLLSPHSKEDNSWIYDSVDTTTGKHLRIDVEKLLRFVNDHFGLDFVKGNMIKE